MANCRVLLVSLLVLCASTYVMTKIVLPHKLRYLENMLNVEVQSKAAKIRQNLAANPNVREGESDWPVVLAKLQEEKSKLLHQDPFHNSFRRRMPNL